MACRRRLKNSLHLSSTWYASVLLLSCDEVEQMFYQVDDSNSTLLSVGETITSFFGTTFEFFNLMESTLLKVGSTLRLSNAYA